MLTTALAFMAAPTFAETLHGCELIPIANSNAMQRADADCPLPVMEGGKSLPWALILAAIDDSPSDPVDPEEPTDPVDPPEEPEEPTEPEDPAPDLPEPELPDWPTPVDEH
jgi:hypothetical protein